mgnify:CR=1 FL=1
MKYRVGFVTNSSSSSYIVAHKLQESQGDLPEVVKSVYDAVIQLFLDDIVLSENDLERFIRDNYGYSSIDEAFEDEEMKKEYEKFLNLLKEGYFISSIEVDYYDSYLKHLLEVLEEKGCLRVVKRRW